MCSMRIPIMSLRLVVFAVFAVFALGGCSRGPELRSTAPAHGSETAYLAGGCFWGMEELLRKVPGVLDTEVGTIHGAETVRVVFDPLRLSYADLLEKHYFRHP